MKTITLTQGLVALVDDADFEEANAHNWFAQKMQRRFYAVRRIRKPDGSQTAQSLHHFLMDPDIVRIDHRDGNGLNNQRSNLRPATHQQNGRGFQRKRVGTSSKYRGVSWFARDKKWRAGIKVNGEQKHLGYFDSEVSAAKAYDIAARNLFGQFATPNFP